MIVAVELTKGKGKVERTRKVRIKSKKGEHRGQLMDGKGNIEDQ